MVSRRYDLSPEEMRYIASMRGKSVSDYRESTDRPGYRVRLKDEEYEKLKSFRKRQPKIDDAEYRRLRGKEAEIEGLLEKLKMNGDVELREISISPGDDERVTVPIIQLSDWHIDEVVKPESVLGMNEFNPQIAQERADMLFYKMCKLIRHHQSNYIIKDVVIALQGDFIGGWIHDELMQTNSDSPLNAIRTVRNMLLSGLKYIHENLDVSRIHVICISGNHSRNTKKIQFSNFNDVSLEYGMYKDLEDICRQIGLRKFEFIIPAAEMAVIEMMGKRMLFAHGHQFKTAGGVGGIYPAMLRWFNKIANVLKLDIAFIGHWHQSISTKQCVVNGSLKGYDAYAIGKGLAYQDPSQNLTLLDSRYGFCLYQEIFTY